MLPPSCSSRSPSPQLLSALGEALGGCLEAHPAGGAALFAVAWEGAAVLLAVELGGRFPADKPEITLHAARWGGGEAGGWAV